MLIYHLDAFVFSDRLQEFLDMGYDYIGAPWPSPVICGEKRLYVGNGGFSLRRIKAFINAIKNYGDWTKIFEKDEDCFFSYLGKVKNSNFHVAPLSVAINFAWEIFPEKNHKKIKKLPFGCHGFHKWDPWYYFKIFSELGWDVSSLIDKSSLKKTLTIPEKYSIYAFERLKRNLIRGDSLKKYLPKASAPVLCCPFSASYSPFLQALYNEGYSIANPENIIVYDIQNVEDLVSDFKKVTIFRLIVNFDYDNKLIRILEENGIVYGRDYISFWREYLRYESKLLRKIVSPQSTENIDYDIKFYA